MASPWHWETLFLLFRLLLGVRALSDGALEKPTEQTGIRGIFRLQLQDWLKLIRNFAGCWQGCAGELVPAQLLVRLLLG